MIYHDNTFEELATAPVKSSHVEVAKLIDTPDGYIDDTTVWASDTVLMSVTVDAVGAFLGTVTKKATVKLLGVDHTARAGELFQVRLGLYNDDPSVYGFNNISLGFFLVDNVDYDFEAGSTTVVLYDYMWTAAKTPYPLTLTYPATVQELAEQIVPLLDTELMVDFDNLPNYDYEIAEDPYALISNATIQTVIQEIAASTGTTARFTDDTLVFSQYEVSDEVLTSNELKKLKVGDAYGPVTSVILGRVPQNDNVALANTPPNANLITDIDTGTNLFTVPDHGMVDGSLTQVTSDGTLPAPLEAGVNYYAFTDDETDTFALTPSYADGLAGTNIINLTTEGTGNITLSQLRIQEVQINNIEILDDAREDLLPPLYTELLGIGWHESDATTVGLGWHEVGDVISYEQNGEVYHSFLSEVHLKLQGSVQETLKAIVPDIETINYQTAGGILKTLYNTEIKVDKQNNDITSVVSQQEVYQNETLESFTEVYQAIDGVTTQIQSAGGGNFIINSVGRAVEPDSTLRAWVHSGTGTVSANSSAGSLAAGATSGTSIDFTGASPKITQRIPVATTKAYSLGFRVNKLFGDGSARVSLVNDVTNYYIDIELGESYTWDELVLENIVPGQNYWDVIIEVTDETTKIEVTDLRVLFGDTISPWVQSQNEILNTQVALTTEGIRVSSSSNPGDYTVMTPIEFKGYSNISGSSQPVFWLNRDTTRTEKLSVNDGIDFGTTVDGTGGVLRAVVVSTGTRQGVAFVGAVE